MTSLAPAPPPVKIFETKKSTMTPPTPGKNFNRIKYIGRRPANDEDNHCRAKLAQLVRDVGWFHEICAEKLYLICLAEGEDSKLFCDNQSQVAKNPFIFWGFHDKPSLSYEGFNFDFGPFNLATTHQFCSKLKVWLDTQSIRETDKYIVIVLDDTDPKRNLNITLLVAIAAMVLLNLTDQEVISRLDFRMTYKPEPGEKGKNLNHQPKIKFMDVSGNRSRMVLTLEDCIEAFYSAIQAKFYNYYDFDQAEYLFYETVMSGDLNWIVPGKILAFAGPSDKPVNNRIYHKHPPQFYYQYFKDNNVTTIIRLNDPEYESSDFRNSGFDHHDLIFPDGYPPTPHIATEFIKIVDEAKGAVAVHCYAGIGRTGTLIAAYLMSRYDFRPHMAVAWTRICRPGSVIGEQQDWLYIEFDKYHKNWKPKSGVSQDTIGQSRSDSVKIEHAPKTTYAIAEKAYGQAKALLLAKKSNFERPCTRNSGLLRSLDEGDESKSLRTKKTDTIIDLGKTIPLMMYLSDLKEGENPKYYRFKDGKYEWKVKFPKSGYVQLKHEYQKDLQAAKESGIPIGHIYNEPQLIFKYEEEEYKEIGSNPVSKVKLKPLVCFRLVHWETS